MVSTTCVILLFAFFAALMHASPVKRSASSASLLNQLTHHKKVETRCNVEGEFESEDPCKPFCVCSKGVVICAEITCTDEFDMPDEKAVCGKVHAAGRCCHNYLCVHPDGTGTMVYPLPIVSAPDELYESR